MAALHSLQQPQTPGLCFPVFSGCAPDHPSKKLRGGAAGAGVLSQKSRTWPLRCVVPTTLTSLLQTVASGLFWDQQWLWDCFRSKRHRLPSCCSEMRIPDYCVRGGGPYRKDRSTMMLGTGLPQDPSQASGGVARKPCYSAGPPDQGVPGHLRLCCSIQRPVAVRGHSN